MGELLYGWSMDKRVDDFSTVADNLLRDGQTSRAETVLYLIERCKRAEAHKQPLFASKKLPTREECQQFFKDHNIPDAHQLGGEFFDRFLAE